MLWVDEARRRCTFVPVVLVIMALGLGLAAAAVAVVPGPDPRALVMVALLVVLVAGWAAFGWRHVGREADEIVVRSLSGTQRAPAKGSEVALQQGGGYRSPHLDVLLRPAGGPALRLARHELLGLDGAARSARRIAALLDVPVDERSVGELERRLGVAADQRRAGWRWLAILVGVGLVLSVVMSLVVAGTMATVVVRCPGGQVREGGMTMLDGLEMTADPGLHAYELRPAEGPAWTQRVDLVEGQTTVLDCSARPPSSPAKGSMR